MAPIVELKIQTRFGKLIKIKATVTKKNKWTITKNAITTKESEDVEVTI